MDVKLDVKVIFTCHGHAKNMWIITLNNKSFTQIVNSLISLPLGQNSGQGFGAVTYPFPSHLSDLASVLGMHFYCAVKPCVPHMNISYLY